MGRVMELNKGGSSTQKPLVLPLLQPATSTFKSQITTSRYLTTSATLWYLQHNGEPNPPVYEPASVPTIIAHDGLLHDILVFSLHPYSNGQLLHFATLVDISVYFHSSSFITPQSGGQETNVKTGSGSIPGVKTKTPYSVILFKPHVRLRLGRQLSDIVTPSFLSAFIKRSQDISVTIGVWIL